jgi:hypothetical protein
MIKEIFVARAKRDYGSDYEKEKLEFINKTFPDYKIIPLPNLEELQDKSNKSIKYGEGLMEKEIEFFFPLIDRCEIFIMLPIWYDLAKDGSKMGDKGELSKGVKPEALYALSVKKKVYELDFENKLNRINTIHDSEELIDELVTQDKKNRLYGRMKELFKDEKRLIPIIHPKMMGFLERNKNVRNLIKNFLSSNRKDIRSIKPISIQPRYPGLDYRLGYNNPIRYIPYNSNRLYTINDIGINDLKNMKGEMHFYECFFDENVNDSTYIDKEFENKKEEFIKLGNKIENFKPWMVFNNHIIGLSIVFDLDCDSDIFNKNTWNKCMILKNTIEKELDIRKLKHKSSTTGNGFNITTQPYWFDIEKDTFFECSKEIYEMYKNINSLLKPYINGVKIDDKIPDWSMYKKMPFTYHAKWNRITLPVSDGDVDREFIMKISDIDDFLRNEKNNTIEVIEKSKWNNNNWWFNNEI